MRRQTQDELGVRHQIADVAQSKRLPHTIPLVGPRKRRRILGEFVNVIYQIAGVA